MYFSVKSIHFGHVHCQLFAPAKTRVYGKVLSPSYQAIVVFEQSHFPANVFHEIAGITDALEKNAHDQNEQTYVQLAF